MKNQDQDRSLQWMLTEAVQWGESRLASGRISKYYLDARQVTLTASGARRAGMEIMRLIKMESPVIHAVGGPATAAVPLIGACLSVAVGPVWQRPDLVGFYTLAAPKDHGTGKQVHGPLEAGMTVVLVDDVATSGKSLIKSAHIVRELGCIVNTAICLVDRLEGALEALDAEDITLTPLYTIRDLGIQPEEQTP